MDKYKLSVNCAFGIENILKRELQLLGKTDLKAQNGSIVFDGDSDDVANCNMFLRTAERVFIEVARFNAETFDGLFDGVYGVDWQNYLTPDACIVVNAKSVKSDLFALSAIQSISKKAIIKKLTDVTKNSVFSETGARYNIEVNLSENQATVLIDTSGAGLHKRGYRDYVAAAPLKETLACAILLLSDFGFDRPFYDPFCGSGTLVTEGARIALNVASGRDRDFAYTHWQNFDKTAYSKAKQRALDSQKTDRKIDFCGGDVNPKAIELCERHARRAGISDKVKFFVADVADFKPATSHGTIVTNPPYGQRLLDVKSARILLRTLGDNYKNAEDWSAFILTADDQAERAFGKRADKKRKLFNAQTQCNLYQFFKHSNTGKYFTPLRDFL